MKGRLKRYLFGLILAAALWPLCVQAQQANETQKTEKMEYSGEEEGTDPFAIEEKAPEPTKQEAEKKPLPPMTIQGLIWGGPIPQAIINNRVVRSGDVIDGVRVTQINKEGVWFSYEGQWYNMTGPGLESSRQEILKKEGGGTNEGQN